MGLLKAALGAASGVLADQWKEFFYCDSLAADVLLVKGQKRTTSRGSNNGVDNIISDGSGIAVADGQCMIIVEQGKVVDFCAEPGEYTYDASTEPSIFSGNLGESIKNTFKTLGKRFTYGGETGKDQRVYYFNTKELMDNKFGTANPIMFRVVDNKLGLDMDTALRCSGVYSYRIIDPILFYSNVTGNVKDRFTRAEIDSQLKTEFVSALQPALAKLSELELRPNQIPAHVTELEDALNEALSSKWAENRGLKVVSVALGSVSIPDEDMERIKNANPLIAGATMVSAQAEVMKTAAGNAAGAMTGFMGMGMAQASGGINAQDLYNMAAQQRAASAPAAPAAEAPAAEGWKCSCGATATGKFCPECGAAKPLDPGSWKCSCGAVNTGKFCSECGAAKPAAPKCPACGWEVPEGTATPKFCPECGVPFGNNQ